MLVKALKQLDGVHFNPFGTSAGSNPSSVIYLGRDITGRAKAILWTENDEPILPGRVSSYMDTNLLNTNFARIGARLKAADRPPRRSRTSGVISLDVQTDRKGEFFEILRQAGGEAEIAVLDVQPADRHLMLLVREGKEKSKFLCGHDERHFFVAGIPESAPVGTVRQAKEALKPAEVQLERPVCGDVC